MAASTSMRCRRRKCPRRSSDYRATSRRRCCARTRRSVSRCSSEISKIAAERDAFIEERVKADGGAADSLDQQIYEAVREQAAPLGLRYESGPKF